MFPTRSDLFLCEAIDSPAGRVHGKKSIRRNQVLEALRTNGPLSRVEITRLLGFNIATVSTVVDSLLADGLVNEDLDKKPGLGRPPTPVSLNARAGSVIGVDISRGSSSAVLIDLQGNILAHVHSAGAFEVDSNEAEFLVRDLVQRLAESVPGPIPAIAGVGVAIAGVFYSIQGGARRLDARAETVLNTLRNAIGAPIIAEGDSRALALAEMWFGGRADMGDYVVLNVTEGLGVTMVTGRRVLDGSRGHAGDLGHVQMGDSNVPCFCGRKACLENIASGSGIVRMARDAGIIGPRSRSDFEAIARLARNGNSEAVKVWKRFSVGLGKAIALTVQLLDPETIVVGGRLAPYSDLFLEGAAKSAQACLPDYQWPRELLVSELDHNAICLGASACVLNRIFGSSHLTVESVI